MERIRPPQAVKLFTQFPDAGLHVDGPIKHLLLDWLPNQVPDLAQADAVICPTIWHPGFTFNAELLRLNKPVVIFDYLEFGCYFGDRENRLGHGTADWPAHLKSPEWDKLDAWVREQPPALVFKRELFQRDVTDKLIPIDFPCSIAPPAIQSRAEFEARPFEVFSCWGHSSPDRPRVHGDIFHAMGNRGINVLSDWSQLERMPEGSGRTWVSIYSPHWARQPIARVMEIQQQAQLSVSLPGAGQKCFRSSESACGSIMALQEDSLAWSYPWIHQQNCLRLRPGNELDDLLSAIQLMGRYQIYLQSQITFELYRCNAYANDYVVRQIEQRL